MKNIFTLAFTIAIIFINSLTCANAALWEELAILDNCPNIPAMAAANGKIYVLSGTGSGSAKTHEYDPATNVWTDRQSIPQSCYWATAVELGGKIYVMGGGQPYPGRTYNQVYNPQSDSWSSGADLLTKRMYHSAASVNGKIYLIGGQNGDNASEWQFDEYDPALDKWTTKLRPLHNEAWYCAAVGLDKTFYRIGGGGANSSLTRNFFNSYNTETDSWTELPPFPIKVHAPSAVAYQSRIYLMGGTYNQESIDSIYSYTTGSGQWILTLYRLPQPMTYHKAAIIDNYIYVFFKDDSDSKGHIYRMKIPGADVSDNSKTDNQVFPNPSSGILYIRGLANHSVNSAKLYNSMGKELCSDLIIKDGTIDLGGLDLINGLYFLSYPENGKMKNNSVMIIK